MVVIGSSSDAESMARRFAEAIRELDYVRELRFRWQRSVAQFWLVTNPIDLVTEESLYSRSQLLYEALPSTEIDFQVINGGLFSPFDPSDIIPADAERIITHG